jgi:putative ABC transport system substrate-binding protein
MTHKLPASVGYAASGWGDAGFLIAYAAEYNKMSARAAEMAVSILKGAKPGDIPIEQATNYKLTVNLKTARALGITVPQSVLLRADRVIE